jgi:hypothetical protein
MINLPIKLAVQVPPALTCPLAVSTMRRVEITTIEPTNDILSTKTGLFSNAAKNMDKYPEGTYATRSSVCLAVKGRAL